MEISWIKLKTKMFDDEKIQLIEAMPEADAILVIWIKLLILAGKTNSNGFIFLNNNLPYSAEMISTIFRRPLQIVKFALKTLRDFDMIEVTQNNVICISNWEKHQNIEGLERVREQNRIRQAKFKEKKLLLSGKNEEVVTLDNVSVTQQIKNKIKKENKSIDIPEFKEFLEYCKTLKPYNLSLDFQIEAKYNQWKEDGWKDGYGKLIKNWKTKIQNTITFLRGDNGNGTSKKRSANYVSRDEYESELKQAFSKERDDTKLLK